jgi:hypothetical protein
MLLTRYLKQFIPILLIVGLWQACKKETEDKQPTASFTSDKTEYLEGETIYLSSNSENADTHRWTLPDGQTIKGANANYVIETLTLDRNVQFKLEVFSKSGTKSDYMVKNIPVKARMGQLVIYNYYYVGSWAVTATIDASINQVSMPQTQQEPNCGEGGHPTFSLKEGTHYVSVRAGNTTLWSGTVYITNNQCLKLRVF